MIPTITPTTTELSSAHVQAEEILIIDHMPPYNSDRYEMSAEPFTFFKNTIAELFWKKGIDYNNKTFYIDSYFLFDDFLNLKIYKKHFFIDEIKNFKKKFADWNKVPEFEVTHSLTFMSNKSRPHRDLCSLLLESWRLEGLNFKYSYNSNPYSLIVAKDLLGESNISVTNLLSDNFYGDLSSYKKWSHGGVQNYGTNVATFKMLFSQIFENCGVGIITEPNFYERGNMFSEKTIMSVYCGQFLIWPGSYKMAETAKKLGFDVFDDIIDHSYQYIKNPAERVINALLNNKDLLFDINKLNKLRKQNIARLNENLKLMRNIDTLWTALNNLHTINNI